jgi:hypothetical protein
MKAPIFLAAASALIALGSAVHAQDLFMEGDIVRGAQEGAPGPVCVLTNQFQHLEKVVFRFRVRDQSGKLLDKDELKSLVVELPSGEKLQGYYGGHPPADPTDYFWVAVWVIPTSYPSGTLTYKATVMDMAGHAQTWEPIRRVTSQLQVMPGEITFKKP